MVTITALWLPILIAAMVVFIASSVFHMVLNFHGNDFSKMASEDDIMEAMRTAGVGPGSYSMPHMTSFKEMEQPELKAKMEKGPVGFLTVLPSGPPAMGAALGQWFGFTLLMGIFVAYVTGRTVDAGVEYLRVFQVAGTVAFLGYAGGYIPQSIWMGKSWASTGKFVFEGLVYSLLTAGAFGWLWPR